MSRVCRVCVCTHTVYLCVESRQTAALLIITKTDSGHTFLPPLILPCIRELLPARWPLSQRVIHPPFSPSGPGNILRFLVPASPSPPPVVAINTAIRRRERSHALEPINKQSFRGSTPALVSTWIPKSLIVASIINHGCDKDV